MRTFYEILGVNRNATQEEILAAYRKRCLETHPDRGGNETDFLNVRKGYEILSNPEKRVEYDKWIKAKEEIERKESLSSIKKRLEPWVNSFLNQYCQDDFFKTLILTYFYGVDSIFINIDRTKLNKVLTAEVVKNILAIIREDNTYNIESVLALDSICNDVLLGRKEIKITQKVETKSKNKEDVITEIDKENVKRFSALGGWFVLLLGFGFVYLLCNHEAKKIEYTKKEYVEHKNVEVQNITESIPDNDNQNDETKWLYEKFVEKGYEVGSYDEFKKVLQIKEDVDWLYNKGKKEGFIDVDRKSFYKIINFSTEKISAGLKSSQNISEYKETIYNTGDCPYLSWYGSGRKDSESLSELKILNYSSTEAVVLIESSYGSVIRHVYIKNNSTYTIKNIPEGRYRMKVMYGNSWNNEKDNGPGYPKGGFMKNVSFSKSKDNELFDFVFEKTYDGVSYPTYSVTLHKVVNGNMQTESIDKDDFF